MLSSRIIQIAGLLIFGILAEVQSRHLADDNGVSGFDANKVIEVSKAKDSTECYNLTSQLPAIKETFQKQPDDVSTEKVIDAIEAIDADPNTNVEQINQFSDHPESVTLPLPTAESKASSESINDAVTESPNVEETNEEVVYVGRPGGRKYIVLDVTDYHYLKPIVIESSLIVNMLSKLPQTDNAIVISPDVKRNQITTFPTFLYSIDMTPQWGEEQSLNYSSQISPILDAYRDPYMIPLTDSHFDPLYQENVIKELLEQKHNRETNDEKSQTMKKDHERIEEAANPPRNSRVIEVSSNVVYRTLVGP